MIRKLPLHTSNNYIKAILESIIHYNSHAREDIANWLYEGYKEAGFKKEKKISKKTIILELLSKWAEVFEDIALLGIMFSGFISKEPFEIYAKYNTQELARFLNRAKSGLSDALIRKIYAIPSVNELLKLKIIRNGEKENFQKEIKDSIESGRKTFKNLAREFIEKKRRGKGTIDYGLLIRICFKTKHGFKIIQQTDMSKRLWPSMQDDEINVVDDIKTMKWGRKIMRLGTFHPFSDSDVKKLVEQIGNWSKVTEDIALMQLERLKNPYWFVSKVRAKKTKELIITGIKKPGKNHVCLCGSEKKFNSCCREMWQKV